MEIIEIHNSVKDDSVELLHSEDFWSVDKLRDAVSNWKIKFKTMDFTPNLLEIVQYTGEWSKYGPKKQFICSMCPQAEVILNRVIKKNGSQFYDLRVISRSPVTQFVVVLLEHQDKYLLDIISKQVYDEKFNSISPERDGAEIQWEQVVLQLTEFVQRLGLFLYVFTIMVKMEWKMKQVGRQGAKMKLEFTHQTMKECTALVYITGQLIEMVVRNYAPNAKELKGSIKISLEDYANKPEVKIEEGIKGIFKQMELPKEELFVQVNHQQGNNLAPPTNSELLVDQFGYKSSEIFAP